MATESEVYELLQTLTDAYPNHKIGNLKGLAKLWTRKFGDLEAEIVVEAAELHIDESKWFPSIHDMNEQMAKAEYNLLNKKASGVDKSELDEIARADWEAATEEARQFWTQMMKDDGRKMVSPGVWAPA